MVTNKNVTNTTIDIRVDGKKLAAVKTFQYLGSILSEEATSYVGPRDKKKCDGKTNY